LDEKYKLLLKKYPLTIGGSTEDKLVTEARLTIEAEKARIHSAARKEQEEALKEYQLARIKLNLNPRGERERIWKAAMVQDKQAVSEYSKEKPAEDFAEHHMAYRCAKGTPCEKMFQKLYPHRYNFLKALEAGKI
jgi:hypothetical protein